MKNVDINGFICGGAVANTLNWLVHGVEPIINDVDVFFWDESMKGISGSGHEEVVGEYFGSVRTGTFEEDQIRELINHIAKFSYNEKDEELK